MIMKKRNQGITLIALIITIIIMLILVGVSIQLVVNSGLFETAKNATRATQDKAIEEANLGEKVIIDEVEYNLVKNDTNSNTITFTINGTEYTTEKGITWRRWVTEFASDEFEIHPGSHFVSPTKGGDYVSSIEGAHWRRWGS